MNTSSELAQKLLQIKAIRLSPQTPFTWASGLRSPIYCDNRLILSHPALRRYVIDAFVALSRQFAPFDAVAGVATAGIAHGALLAEALQLPFAYVRAKAKDHGRRNMIEGELAPGARVLVVEDLISTGGSCLTAVEALREAGTEVAGVTAIFSYAFPSAAQAFAEAACPWATLSNYPSLIAAAVENGYISADEQQALQDWSADPAAWSARHTAG